MKFSPSANGFYLESIHGNSIPGDAFEISDADHAALLTGQSQGKIIAAGSGGIPVLTDPPAGPLIPQSVTALQGLLAIDQGGLSAAYEDWANDLARTFAQRAFINKAQTWKRDDPTLGAAAASLGLTEAQVDGLFALAATL